MMKLAPTASLPPDERSREYFAVTITILVLSLLTASSLEAQANNVHRAPDPKPNVAAASLSSYLERVRAESSNIQAAPGSIWTDSGRLTRMVTDVRAMRPHDLISVVVSESLAASTDGTVKNSRASNASSAFSGLIGTLHPGNGLQNLVNQTLCAPVQN
jgi:flagellar L-ring protein precursor FlgH